MGVGSHNEIIDFVWQESDPAECERAHNKLVRTAYGITPYQLWCHIQPQLFN